jgi:hypothetical protein
LLEEKVTNINCPTPGMYLAKNICIIFFMVLFFFVWFALFFVSFHYFYIQSKKLAGGFNGIGDISTSLFNMLG